MFCEQCGETLKQGMQQCPNCGCDTSELCQGTFPGAMQEPAEENNGENRESIQGIPSDFAKRLNSIKQEQSRLYNELKRERKAQKRGKKITIIIVAVLLLIDVIGGVFLFQLHSQVQESQTEIKETKQLLRDMQQQEKKNKEEENKEEAVITPVPTVTPSITPTVLPTTPSPEVTQEPYESEETTDTGEIIKKLDETQTEKSAEKEEDNEE